MNTDKHRLEDLTPDERYVYEERLALLGCYGQPTGEQHELAMADVERFKIESNNEIYGS